MKKVFNTILIILLALGLLGIILGIVLGLYRNDMLAKMQAAEEIQPDSGDEILQEQLHGDDLETDAPDVQTNRLVDILLWDNLHTKFLVAGTLLTILCVTILLINVRGTFLK